MAFFRKRQSGPVARTVIQGDRILTRLRYRGVNSAGWKVYEVAFIGINPEQWKKSLEESDPRDLPWMVKMSSGPDRDFCHFQYSYTVASPEYSVLAGPLFMTKAEGLFPAVAGIARERRVVFKRRLRKRRIIRDIIGSDELRVLASVTEAQSFASQKEARWVLELLLRCVVHRNPHVRAAAIKGVGEIARRFGTVPQNVDSLLRMLEADEHKFVRQASSTARQEIARFGVGP
jgi:hypothetical protein